MKTNNKTKTKQSKSLEEALDNKADNQRVSAQKDGFRYDYTDASDFKNEK